MLGTGAHDANPQLHKHRKASRLMRLRSIDFRLSDEQPDLKPEGKNMAISTVLTTYLNGLSDGEARQLVSHLKKHSFDGNILTAEGQAHLRDAEILSSSRSGLSPQPSLSVRQRLMF